MSNSKFHFIWICMEYKWPQLSNRRLGWPVVDEFSCFLALPEIRAFQFHERQSFLSYSFSSTHRVDSYCRYSYEAILYLVISTSCRLPTFGIMCSGKDLEITEKFPPTCSEPRSPLIHSTAKIKLSIPLTTSVWGELYATLGCYSLSH